MEGEFSTVELVRIHRAIDSRVQFKTNALCWAWFLEG